MMTLQPQAAAPHFSAFDQDHQLHTLKEYRGKWLLLYFYPADDTPGCTTEACSFRDAFHQLSHKVNIVGVSRDTEESHQAFVKKYGLPFTLLADPEQNIIKTYQATGLLLNKRISFLINPDGLIEKIYPVVDVHKHAQEILEDVNLLNR